MDPDVTSETPPPAEVNTRSDEAGTNVPSASGNGIATTGGVMGIIALIVVIMPLIHPVTSAAGWGGVVLIFLAFPLGVAALVLGLIGFARAYRPGGVGAPMAVIGMLGGSLAAVVSLAWWFSPGGMVM